MGKRPSQWIRNMKQISVIIVSWNARNYSAGLPGIHPEDRQSGCS